MSIAVSSIQLEVELVKRMMVCCSFYSNSGVLSSLFFGHNHLLFLLIFDMVSSERRMTLGNMKCLDSICVSIVCVKNIHSSIRDECG